MKEVKNSILGQCPKCKSDNLRYSGSNNFDDDGYVYEVDCGECGWEGQEHHELCFVAYYEE